MRGCSTPCAASAAKLVIVVHANHPAEIDARRSRPCGSCVAYRTALLNQSVLLAGVNDDAATCWPSCRSDCSTAGVLPYYLHQLDPVAARRTFPWYRTRVRRQLLRQLNATPAGLPGATAGARDCRSRPARPPL